MNATIPTIGLTGGIGSGKSTIANFFKELGCIVANADTNAKAALQTQPVQKQLVEWWGDGVLDSEGNIDTRCIAEIIFNDDSARERLEKLLHPLARLRQDEQFSEANDETVAFVIDAPLLIEVGLHELCDVIVFIDASEEIRYQRVQKNRGWTIEELNRRESAQLPLDTKRKKADYVVINEGDLHLVQTQVQQILDDIRMKQLD